MVKTIRCIYPLFFLCSISLLTSCVNSSIYSSSDFNREKIKSLVILPFENPGIQGLDNQILEFAIATELRKQKAFRQVSIEAKETLKEQIVKSDGIIESALNHLEGNANPPARPFKNFNQFDGILRGKIIEYRYKKGIAEEPIIGLHLQIVSPGDFKLLWEITLSANAGYFHFSESSLSKLTLEVAQQVTSAILNGK